MRSMQLLLSLIIFPVSAAVGAVGEDGRSSPSHAHGRGGTCANSFPYPDLLPDPYSREDSADIRL